MSVTPEALPAKRCLAQSANTSLQSREDADLLKNTCQQFPCWQRDAAHTGSSWTGRPWHRCHLPHCCHCAQPCTHAGLRDRDVQPTDISGRGWAELPKTPPTVLTLPALSRRGTPAAPAAQRTGGAPNILELEEPCHHRSCKKKQNLAQLFMFILAGSQLHPGTTALTQMDLPFTLGMNFLLAVWQQKHSVHNSSQCPRTSVPRKGTGNNAEEQVPHSHTWLGAAVPQARGRHAPGISLLSPFIRQENTYFWFRSFSGHGTAASADISGSEADLLWGFISLLLCSGAPGPGPGPLQATPGWDTRTAGEGGDNPEISTRKNHKSIFHCCVNLPHSL